MPRTTTMWEDVDLYDLEHDLLGPWDLPFWVSLIDEHRPRRVLEIGCGTGRLIEPLVRAGLAHHDDFELVGIDLSEPFLARAEARAVAVREHVTLLRMDMRALVGLDPFDLVVVPLNTLAYLHTAEDRLACFASLRSVLAPGGRLAFDLVSPVGRLGMLADCVAHEFPALRLESDYKDVDDEIARLQVLRADTYEPATQTLSTTYVFEGLRRDGTSFRRIHDLDWHMYSPCELDLLLRHSGFAVEARHGENYLMVCSGR